MNEAPTQDHLRELGVPFKYDEDGNPMLDRETYQQQLREPDCYEEPDGEECTVSAVPIEKESTTANHKHTSSSQFDSGSKYRAMTAAELATSNVQLDYIIKDILVAGQSCIIAGPEKGMKTTLALDLAISLATAGNFLGRFPVKRKCRVLFCSGESGLATIKETAIRICKSKGIKLEDIDGLYFDEALPRIDEKGDDVATFAKYVKGLKVDFGILDPMYLMRSGEGAENLSKSGNPLAKLTRMCLLAGATPIVCDHLKKSRTNDNAPAGLSDLLYAGPSAMFRQWILLSRRKPYEFDGNHFIWAAVGGSAGHSSLWGVNVTEGLQEDEGGRKYIVSAQRSVELKEQEKQAKDYKKSADREDKLATEIQSCLKALEDNPGGLSKSAMFDLADITSRRRKAVFAALLGSRELVETKVIVGKSQPVNGYKLSRLAA